MLHTLLLRLLLRLFFLMQPCLNKSASIPMSHTLLPQLLLRLFCLMQLCSWSVLLPLLLLVVVVVVVVLLLLLLLSLFDV
jgi:hypothetical protein